MGGVALISALAHSLFLLLVLVFSYPSMEILGAGGYYAFGPAAFVCLLTDMNTRVVFLNYTHNIYTVGAIVASFVGLAMWLFVYTGVSLSVTGLLTSNMYGVVNHLWSVRPFWISVFSVPLLPCSWDLFCLVGKELLMDFAPGMLKLMPLVSKVDEGRRKVIRVRLLWVKEFGESLNPCDEDGEVHPDGLQFRTKAMIIGADPKDSMGSKVSQKKLDGSLGRARDH